jgi:hypothetical protein
MNARARGMLGNRQGGTLAMVAVCMVAILGMSALAVDLAAGYAWRAEAQKIADSGALAGGSAFLDLPDAEAVPEARNRAYEYALQHTIKGVQVDSSELTVEVIEAERKVRVTVRRTGLPVWFSRVLGFDSLDVAALAAAQAVAAGAARCLKPIALPDLWTDADQDDGDNVWEPGEDWEYGSDPNDRYQRWDGPGDPDGTSATGYGSDARNDLDGDYGRSVQIKATDPQSEFNFEPGIFFPWRLPPDPNMEECDKGGGGSNDAGAATYRQNICSCNVSPIQLDTPYELQPGNMVGPTYQGVSELIDEDPDVYWEPNANSGQGGPARPDPNAPSGWEDLGTGTSRVVKIALFDPTQITASGMQTIEFNNFALMFLEAQANPQAPVVARFMYFASGEESTGPTQGSLVRYLRLVE